MAPSTPGGSIRYMLKAGQGAKGQELFLMDRTQLYQLRVQLSSLQKDLSRLDTCSVPAVYPAAI
jgi:hypothetical protein